MCPCYSEAMTRPQIRESRFAPLLLPQLRKELDAAADPALTAVALSLAGMADAHRTRTPQVASACLRELVKLLDSEDPDSAAGDGASYLTAVDAVYDLAERRA